VSPQFGVERLCGRRSQWSKDDPRIYSGIAEETNQEIDIKAAQFSDLTYQSGSGTDTLWVRANDGTVWGAWSQAFPVTAPVDTGPASNINTRAGQTYDTRGIREHATLRDAGITFDATRTGRGNQFATELKSHWDID
jgi:hypothetical protein